MNEWTNKFICQAVQGFSRDREKLTHSKHLPSPGIRLKALPEFLTTTHTTSWDRNYHYSRFADEEIELSDLPKPQGWNMSWPQNTLLPIGYTAYGSPISSPHSPPPFDLASCQPALRAHPCSLFAVEWTALCPLPKVFYQQALLGSLIFGLNEMQSRGSSPKSKEKKMAPWF